MAWLYRVMWTLLCLSRQLPWSVRGQDQEGGSVPYRNSAILLNCTTVTQQDQSVLTASWDSNSTHLFLELIGQTTGWMAFGISPTGAMDLSDIMFGWCDDAETNASSACYAQDRFVQVDRMAQRVDLLSDHIQNWHLLFGKQNDTHTVIRAARALLTPDNQQDYPVTRNIFAIYAVGEMDPDVTTGEVIKHTYHGARLLTVLPGSVSATGTGLESTANQAGIWTPSQPASPFDHAIQNTLMGSSSSGSSHLDNSHNTFFPTTDSNGLDSQLPDAAQVSIVDQTTLLQLIVRTLHGLAGLLDYLNSSIHPRVNADTV